MTPILYAITSEEENGSVRKVGVTTVNLVRNTRSGVKVVDHGVV